jgi:hypothetical protein
MSLSDDGTAVAVHLIRPLTDGDVQCPAGSCEAGGTGVYCAIERGLIDARRNPNSVEGFCLGEYLTCPTWRREKEREWAHESVELVDRRPADLDHVLAKRRAKKERLARAQELMESNSEEGRKFRARVQRLTDPTSNPFVRTGSTTAERVDFTRSLASGR